MGKPDASRTLRFELNRLDLADMTVKPHTIKIVGPTPTPDIAGLCKKLRRAGLKSSVEVADTLERQAADTLERQTAEIERLRGALERLANKDNEFDSEAQIIAEAALTGEDTAGSPSSQNTEPGLAFFNAGEP
jgi:hypothetical protein